MELYITTYQKYQDWKATNMDIPIYSFPLIKDTTKLGIETCIKVLRFNEDPCQTLITQIYFPTGTQKVQILSYLIILQRDWEKIISRNIKAKSLVNLIASLNDYYDQIIQLTYLLLVSKIITLDDYHSFAKSINMAIPKEFHPDFHIDEITHDHVFPLERLPRVLDPRKISLYIKEY